MDFLFQKRLFEKTKKDKSLKMVLVDGDCFRSAFSHDQG